MALEIIEFTFFFLFYFQFPLIVPLWATLISKDLFSEGKKNKRREWELPRDNPEKNPAFWCTDMVDNDESEEEFYTNLIFHYWK